MNAYHLAAYLQSPAGHARASLSSRRDARPIAHLPSPGLIQKFSFSMDNSDGPEQVLALRLHHRRAPPSAPKLAYLVDVPSFLDWVSCGGGPLWASECLGSLFFSVTVNGLRKSIPYGRFVLDCPPGVGARNIRGSTYLDVRRTSFRPWQMPRAGQPVREVLSAFTSSSSYRVIDRDWASEFLKRDQVDIPSCTYQA
jgi:hypothetical protein